MWKSCSKCGKIHEANYECPKIRISKAKTEDQKLRSTNRWIKKSEEIREASKWLCAVCLDEGVYTYDHVEVHHIEKLKDNVDRLLDNYNLVCLCKYHHELADQGKIDSDYLEELAKAREDSR